MRRGATLIESGIDAADINHRLFNSKTPRQIRAEGFIAERIKTEFDERVAYATVTKRERRSLDVLMEHFETAIDVVRSVENVEIAFVIKEMDNGELKVSLRSTGADVASVAKAFGGGGHIRAAGCAVAAKNIKDAARRVLNKIEELYINKQGEAK